MWRLRAQLVVVVVVMMIMIIIIIIIKRQLLSQLIDNVSITCLVITNF